MNANANAGLTIHAGPLWITSQSPLPVAPTLARVKQGQWWVTTADVTYRLNNYTLTVPAGTHSDGVSTGMLLGLVLWKLRILDPRDLAWILLALPHDLDYGNHKLPRILADSILEVGIEVVKKRKWFARAVFVALRLFGASHWGPISKRSRRRRLINAKVESENLFGD